MLLCDEGAGVHAVRELASRMEPSPDVDCVDGGTLGFSLAAKLEGADRLIVLDATQLGAAPGAVRCLLDGEMDHFLGRAGRSVHEVGLLDILDIARISGCLPRERALIGIQPASITWSEQPTEAVSAAVEEAVSLAAQLVAAWPTRGETPGA